MSWKDYFSFTKNEKRGVIVLLAILGFILMSFPFVDYLKKQENPDFSMFEEEIIAFEQQLEQQKEEKHNSKNKLAFLDTIQFFDFNPNTIQDEEWKKLGFKDWQIKTINNYKSKGGYWKTKSDVARIYGLDSIHFEKLYPYILLPEELEQKDFYSDKNTFKNKKYDNNNYEPKAPTIVDINFADTTVFKQLKGIGSAYAKRIVAYRTSLGGFIAKEQLREVWGISEETYQKILPYLQLSTKKISKININTADVDALKTHPYIQWKIANAIVKYRKANGKYQSLEDLNKLHLLDEATIKKITPYLVVE